ncbi:sulfurtransferase TusA family protein [Candidatus Hecatella orcuttiae]|uniref:sulfurtransferase TusA family protein n=1 Tax=Candidatus Hecatella orcuttiae TaxID=1935119 RepID=UPI002867DBFB|nr:sulfurtransferase TusA family protein [Candidatus Hecatella orcuttiae]
MTESTQNSPRRILDLVGLYCPEPVFRTRKELDSMAVGETLEVIADDPASEEDIQSLLRRLGHQLLRLWKTGREIHFLIKKTKQT